jgi:hypothetical protein
MVSYFFDPNTTTNTVVLNYTSINPHTTATPAFLWICIALATLTVLIISLWLQMRNERGETNVSKVQMTILSILMCAYTAWLSPVIDWSEGVGAGAFGFNNGSLLTGSTEANDWHHFYVTAMHTQYEMPGVVMFFIILGLLCFGNLIWIVTRPELLIPDDRELSGPIKARTRAEGRGRGRGRGRLNKAEPEESMGGGEEDE